MNINLFKKYPPIKKLGQNFLQNSEIIKKIVQNINPQSTEYMLEIGSGYGALTIPISRIVKELIVLEIDENLILFLSKKVCPEMLRIFLVDALEFDYKNFFLQRNTLLFRIFGNLPYNISTIFLLKTIFFQIHIYDMNLMFQKEVAERIMASPNTKKYGRLSVIIQNFYKITMILSISKENFFPKPKISSTFLKFVPILNKNKSLKYIFLLEYITKIAFSNRRKILKNSLGKLFSEKKMISLGINPKYRAENLSVKQYEKLVNSIILENLL
ncbi:16S rRNA (adenine(1518)-N(6)/adenine(1519)-N(6))-dimethyltransferase RsmA [Buchnera aphidicola]|uniref:16S rRNA (adenine(1518)-N(6)/adenine(1519)-N(6))- dimethyltransferase RsmA n=1 Tax=Buchnera aphidicola TaxID=9 RepID=UPI0031B6B2DB